MRDHQQDIASSAGCLGAECLLGVPGFPSLQSLGGEGGHMCVWSVTATATYHIAILKHLETIS